MAATGLGNDALQTAIALSGAGLITTIANGATGVSGAFSVPAVTGATGSYCDRAHLEITATSFTPTSTGYLQGCFITNDGGGYDPFWVASGQLYPDDETFFSVPLQAAATTFVKVKGLLLPAALSAGSNVELVLLNESGVSVTITGVNLYPFGGSAG